MRRQRLRATAYRRWRTDATAGADVPAGTPRLERLPTEDGRRCSNQHRQAVRL